MTQIEAAYEVHIVGYRGTDLSNVPKPFFTNEISQSTQGFAQIATSEQDDRLQAHADFEAACRWSASKFADPDQPGVHVKLEAVCEQQIFSDTVLQTPPISKQTRNVYIRSALVSAWDVHLDGTFDPELKQVLHDDGYIILDYRSSRDEPMSTLTMHFLQPDECSEEYRRICEFITKTGGFSGNIYWEHPLAFAVYGNTIPRPIIASM